MAKITINPITSSLNIETAINDRLQQIEDAFNNDVLYRGGFTGEDNTMAVDLDMAGHAILNATQYDESGNSLGNYVDYAREWAINPEDDAVSIEAGGDNSTTFSSYHWAQKAAASGTSASASASAAAASEAAAAAYADGAQAAIGNVEYVTFADSPIAVTQSGILYSVDTSGGNVVFTLPSIASLTGGFAVAFKKTTSDTNVITVNPNGTDVIDGAGSLGISDQNGGYTIIADDDPVPDEWTSMAFGAAAGGLSGVGSVVAAFGAVSTIGTDITTAVQDIGNILDVSAQTTNPLGLWVSPDESVILVNDASYIYKYTVSTPGDLTTASYDSTSSLMTGSGIGALRNVFAYYTGTNTVWLLGDSSNKKIWYTTATGNIDVTSISASVTTGFLTTGINAEFTGMHVNDDGKIAYVCGGLDPDKIGEVFLSEEYLIELNGGTFVGDIYDVFSQNPSAEGIIWTNDGMQFGVLDDSQGFAVYDTVKPFRVKDAVYNSYLITSGVNTSIWDGYIRGTRLYLVGTNTNDAVYIMEMTEQQVPAIPSKNVRGDAAIATKEDIRAGRDVNSYMTPRDYHNALNDIDAKAFAIGTEAMGANGVTSSNLASVAVGYRAGYDFNGSQHCVAVGANALGNDSSADYCIAIGSEALYGANNFSGSGTIAIGYQSMQDAGSGTDYSICIGYQAGRKITNNADNNVYIGKQTGPYISASTGAGNVGLGYLAASSITTGASNTILGPVAGDVITTGSKNVCIGYNAGPTSGTTSDRLYIHNSRAGASSLIYGDFATGAVTINGTLNVTGGTSVGGYTDDGTGTTIDFSATPVHRIAPTAASNPTYTFTAPVAGATVTLIGVNLGAAGTITWPATLKWVGGTEPTWTAAGTDIVRMVYDGTNYWASVDLNLS